MPKKGDHLLPSGSRMVDNERPLDMGVSCEQDSMLINKQFRTKLAVLLPGRAIAITYRVFVNQENSALPNLAQTLTLTLTLTLN